MRQSEENSDVEAAATMAKVELLPAKSKTIYKKQYDKFITWCTQNNVKHYTEDVMLAYFFEKAKELKASTLWSQYSMLKCMLNFEKDIDIGKFYKLTAFLKRKNVGYKAKKSNILTTKQVEQFLSEAPDETFLMAKAALILGVAGPCRGDELVHLHVGDLKEIDSLTMLCTIRNTKNGSDRKFVINNSEGQSVDFLKLLKKYMNLRKEDTNHSRFFVQFRSNKCTSQPVGKNAFEQLPQKIAAYLKLSEPSSYTGHCFRRTSASLLADTGVHIDVLKRHGGWKSSTVAEGYVENSIKNKEKIATKIFGGEICRTDRSVCDANQIDKTLNLTSSSTRSMDRLFNIVSCANVNVNVNFVSNKND